MNTHAVKNANLADSPDTVTLRCTAQQDREGSALVSVLHDGTVRTILADDATFQSILQVLGLDGDPGGEFYLTVHAGPLSNSVLQPWVTTLGLRHQGVLMACVRGCDSVPKEDPTKALARCLRAMILVSSDPSPPASLNTSARVWSA